MRKGWKQTTWKKNNAAANEPERGSKDVYKGQRSIEK